MLISNHKIIKNMDSLIICLKENVVTSGETDRDISWFKVGEWKLKRR